MNKVKVDILKADIESLIMDNLRIEVMLTKLSSTNRRITKALNELSHELTYLLEHDDDRHDDAERTLRAEGG